MIRFALILLMSLAVSSQALAAVKWNNKSNSSNEELTIKFQVENVLLPQNYPTKLLSFYPHKYANIPENNHLVIGLYASEDLSNDGRNEIFGAIYVFDENDEYHTSTPAKPFILEWNENEKKLQASQVWKDTFPEMIFPRRFETFKNQRNGTLDVFIADYGVDGRSPKHPNCGGQNRWFQIKRGNIHEKTRYLPNQNDLTHDLIVEDLNKDGLADLIVLNDPVPKYSNKKKCGNKNLDEKPYILMSSNDGFKKYSFAEIGIHRNHLYLAGEAKLNADSSFDLVLSRDGLHSSGGIDIYNLEIINSELKVNKKTSLLLSGTNLGADIRKGDLDGDGRNEFVVSNSASGDWRGNNLYVVSNEKGKWQLSKLFYESELHGNLGSKDRGWCERIFLIDIDGNSTADYVCANRSKPDNLMRPPVIIRKDDKYFPLELRTSRIRQFVPFKIPNTNMLIGTKYGKAGANDVMLEWQFHGFEIK